MPIAFNNRPIAHQILVLILVVLSVVFGALGFLVQREVARVAMDTATHNLQHDTQDISSTVGAILQETRSAVMRMQAVTQSMNESVRLAGLAGDSLNAIDRHTSQTVEVVCHIADGAREQSAASQGIAQLVESIAQASEVANDRAQSNQSQATTLRGLSADLHRQLARFKV